MQRRRSSFAALFLSVALAFSGCQATGHAANAYFEWGGRTFTTNPVSVAPYFIGYSIFFVAFLPLDLFSWVGTMIFWSEGQGEDYQGSALAPSMFMGVTGGAILGAPFFPFGLPWWDTEREDDEKPEKPEKKPAPKEARESSKDEPSTSTPTSKKKKLSPDDVPAGAPPR